MNREEPWAAVGIHGKASALKLLYDPYSEIVIAQVGQDSPSGHFLKHVYTRLRTENQYHLFTPESRLLSYEDVVLSPKGFCLFANVFELVDENDQNTMFNWHGLQALELPSGKVLFELNSKNLEPQPGHRDPGLMNIVSVAGDGKSIVARLAATEQGKTKMGNWLVNLNLDERRYELITELSCTFL